VVDRATELLQKFEETTVTGETLVEEVRKQVRAAGIDEYAGLPAGPNVETSDAVIVVEGRADVQQLLAYGIKNAIAVEGTDIPDAVAQLTRERTTTAFLDGDRGGDLIMTELDQVGDIDYVAFAPDGKSVENLAPTDVRSALEKKLSYGEVTDGTTPREAFAPTEGGTVAGAESTDGGAVTDGARPTTAPTTGDVADDPSSGERNESTDATNGEQDTSGDAAAGEDPAAGNSKAATEETAAGGHGDQEPQTLAGHAEAVIADDTDTVRLLDGDLTTLADADASAAFERIADSEPPPHTVVLDGTVTQRILDIAAQRGVGQVVGAATDEFVKQPTSVRVRTAGNLL
jgi:DNA primase